MLVYEKTSKTLYGTEANVPSENDSPLVYKDIDGDVLTLEDNDKYFDNGAGGIIRESDGKFVGVFIGSAQKAIIPKGWEPVAKVLESIKVTKKPTKTSYTVGDAFATAGMVVTAFYTSGDKEKVTTYTTAPANGDTLSTAGTVEVTVTYVEGEITKTATFNITVTE